MGRPHDAVTVSASVPDELDRQLVQANVRPDLFIWTKRNERGDAVHPRQMPFVGEACGERHHVLFRDPRVDEAFAVGLGDPLDRHVPHVTR